MAIRSRRATADEDAIGRDAHVGQRHRIVQLIERRVQKSRRIFRVAEPALTQEPRHDRRDPEGGGEPSGGGLVTGEGVPAGGTTRTTPDGATCSALHVREHKDTKDTKANHAGRRVHSSAIESNHGVPIALHFCSSTQRDQGGQHDMRPNEASRLVIEPECGS